jgi:hypothetical protein
MEIDSAAIFDIFTTGNVSEMSKAMFWKCIGNVLEMSKVMCQKCIANVQGYVPEMGRKCPRLWVGNGSEMSKAIGNGSEMSKAMGWKWVGNGLEMPKAMGWKWVGNVQGYALETSKPDCVWYTGYVVGDG